MAPAIQKIPICDRNTVSEGQRRCGSRLPAGLKLQNFGHARGIGVEPRYVNCNEAGESILHALHVDDSVALSSNTNLPFCVHYTHIKVNEYDNASRPSFSAAVLIDQRKLTAK